MTDIELLMTVSIAALVTAGLRFIPFLLFSRKEAPPRFISWLGEQLPQAVMAMLVIYCLKDVSFTGVLHYLPDLIAVACVVGLQIWKRSVILSIIAGTAVYMILIHLIV